MEDSSCTALRSGRKLLHGERVEVRQKEKGLRGSWHSGVVAKVKNLRRVVEYDGLLTLDGLKKLRETIPLPEEIKSQFSALRERSQAEHNQPQAEQGKRGFIRPIPPSCPVSPCLSRTKGLLVDAFYKSAWWEGILLNEVLPGNEKLKARILFPDGGDILQISVKNIRVSQEWDEATGLWTVCGFWPLLKENGKPDFSSLKEVWKQRRSVLKELLHVENCHEKGTSWNQKERDHQATLVQKKTGTVSANVFTNVASEGEQPIGPALEGSIAKDHSDSNGLLLQSGETISSCHGVISSDVPLNLSTSGGGRDGLGVTLSETPLNQSLWKNLCHIKVSDSKQSKANHRKNARQTGVGKGGVRLIRNRRDVALKEALRATRQLRQNLQQATSEDKRPIMIRGGSENTSNCEQADMRNSDTGLSNCIDTSLSQHEACHQGSESESRCHEASLPEDSTKLKQLVKKARLLAKKFLVDVGWQIQGRIRSHNLREEAVYVSPSGSRYFSLASACRGWKKGQKMAVCSMGSANAHSRLLDTYNMAAGFMSLQKPCTRQTKAEYMISLASLDGSTKAKSTGVSPSILKGEIDFSEQLLDQNCFRTSCNQRNSSGQEGEVGSHGLIGSSSLQQLKYRGSSLTPFAERCNKRKQTGQDSLHVKEPEYKKSKITLKKASFSQGSKGSRARGGCRMQVLLSLPAREKDSLSVQESGEQSYFKKSTVLSLLIDKGILKENESVCYINRKDGHVMKKGHVTREGVLCSCCKDIFTLSNFEAHAGSKLHRPSANIFLDDGRSLSECLMCAWALQDAKEKKEGFTDSNDDSCGVCGDGGELILCDHCPSTFHADCIGLEVIPEGDWFCPRCCCGVCGGKQLAGEVDKAMFRCAQCELEYHLACVHAHDMVKSERACKKPWFCGHQCEEIFTGLRELVGVSHPLDNGLSWMLLRSMNKDHGITPSSFEVMAEHNSKLSVAHGVMQECFVPMIDPRTKIDLISQALYNRRSKVTRLDYNGFYTMLLERGDEVISVATIRVHGAKLAEMPLVGTRYQYRRQGMCRRLVQALEKMLKHVGVEKLILPAVPELLETWLGAFSFQHMNPIDSRELCKLNLMSFPGTTVLQKHLTTKADIGESLCPLNVSKGLYNPDSSGEACSKVQSHAFVERTGVAESLAMEKRKLLEQSLQSCSEGLSHFQGGMHSFLHTPAIVEVPEGHVNTSFSRGKLKGRNKWRPHTDSPSETSAVGEGSHEFDIYNTKVVLTTTRSKRLVKSSRWVADGLKELAKDAKQSKRILNIEGSVPKVLLSEGTQNLKCDPSLEKNYGQGKCQIIENVYVRTRRRAAPQLAQFEECKELQRALDFSAGDCTSKPVAESDDPPSLRCSDDSTNFTVSNAQPLQFAMSSISPEVNGSRSAGYKIGVLDVSLKADSGIINSSDGGSCALDTQTEDCIESQAARVGLLICTKYYSRRKKRERLDDIAVDSAMEECVAQDTGTQATEFVEQGLKGEATLNACGMGPSPCAVFLSAALEGQGSDTN